MNIKEYLFERKVELSIILVLVISLIVLLFNFDTNQNNYEETLEEMQDIFYLIKS